MLFQNHLAFNFHQKVVAADISNNIYNWQVTKMRFKGFADGCVILFFFYINPCMSILRGKIAS